MNNTSEDVMNSKEKSQNEDVATENELKRKLDNARGENAVNIKVKIGK